MISNLEYYWLKREPLMVFCFEFCGKISLHICLHIVLFCELLYEVVLKSQTDRSILNSGLRINLYFWLKVKEYFIHMLKVFGMWENQHKYSHVHSLTPIIRVLVNSRRRYRSKFQKQKQYYVDNQCMFIFLQCIKYKCKYNIIYLKFWYYKWLHLNSIQLL